MNDPDVVYAVPSHKEMLLNVLAERAGELGYSHASLEDVCGLTAGHVGKLFGPSRCKGMGLDTLYLLLPALGLHLALTVDRDALQRYSQRGPRRQSRQARPANFAAKCGARPLRRVLKHLAELPWNDALHTLADARAALAAERAAKAAVEANKQLPSSERRRGAGQHNGNGTASAYDAPIGDELEQIADAASIRVSRKDGERRGRKRSKMSAPFPSPMDQHAIRRRTQTRVLSMFAKPVTVAR